MTATRHVPEVTGLQRELLARVRAGEVWWNPELHRTHKVVETAEGGYVRRVNGVFVVFVELPELVAVWQLAQAGLIETSRVPADREAAKLPRPVRVTALGAAALRGTETRK